MTTLEAALQVEALSAGYGKSPIIKDVKIQAKKGLATVIIGPNGAGKSTLLKAIFGLIPVFSGHVRLFGEEIGHLSTNHLVRRGLAYVPQNSNVFPSLTVQENLELGGYVHGTTMRENMASIFGMFPDLRKAAHRAAGTLSGGQRQMLAMGRALMSNPTVLLLDEPTAGLSPAYTKVVWEHIRKIAEAKTAVMVVEQNATTALSMADWAYLLVAGQNREEGSAAELLARQDIGKLFLGK